MNEERSGEKGFKAPHRRNGAGHHKLARLGRGTRPAVAKEGVIPEPFPVKNLYRVELHAFAV
jgi:hypothetical protein